MTIKEKICFALIGWSAIRMNTVLERYGHSVRKKTIYKKTWRQNMQWKQRCRWKQNRSMTRQNIWLFPPVSCRMTPNSVCLCRHRVHGESNKHWRQRRFEPLQETGVKKMINGNVSSEFISLWIGVCTELQILSKTASCRWFYAYKKYKNGNSARRTGLP